MNNQILGAQPENPKRSYFYKALIQKFAEFRTDTIDRTSEENMFTMQKDRQDLAKLLLDFFNYVSYLALEFDEEETSFKNSLPQVCFYTTNKILMLCDLSDFNKLGEYLSNADLTTLEEILKQLEKYLEDNSSYDPSDVQVSQSTGIESKSPSVEIIEHSRKRYKELNTAIENNGLIEEFKKRMILDHIKLYITNLVDIWTSTHTFGLSDVSYLIDTIFDPIIFIINSNIFKGNKADLIENLISINIVFDEERFPNWQSIKNKIEFKPTQIPESDLLSEIREVGDQSLIDLYNHLVSNGNSDSNFKFKLADFWLNLNKKYIDDYNLEDTIDAVSYREMLNRLVNNLNSIFYSLMPLFCVTNVDTIQQVYDIIDSIDIGKLTEINIEN